MSYLSKENLEKFGSFITSRTTMVIGIVILMLLLLRQCNATSSAKVDAKREYNNYIASQDSVRKISSSLKNSIYEKSAFELKVSELNDSNKALIAKLALSSNGSGTTPETVIETVTEYRDTGSVKTSNISGKNGDSIGFTYSPTMLGRNKFSIIGKTPYHLNLIKDPNDSSKYIASISTDNTILDISQNIDLVTGIYRDSKNKRLMTRVTTDFPKIKFSDINSFDITDSPATREILKNARRELGIGISIGYGIVGQNVGLYLGLSLNYTPRFLQF